MRQTSRLLRNVRRFHVEANLKPLKTHQLLQMKGPVNLNPIREHDPSLTAEQKQGRKQFLVFRSNPADPDDQPHFRSYWLDLAQCNPMYLDALIKIKDELDPTLAFRRSCREGVCGSCAMNLDGRTTLACINEINKDLSQPAVVTPLGHMFVLRDLVVDMTNFYNQYRAIQPYLQRKTPKPDPKREHLQSEEDRKKLDGLYECVMCASCSTSCPSYWWKPDQFLGPAVLMQAYRWIVDSRDEYTEERLEALDYKGKAENCENIGMCSATCPKGLDPRKAIQDLLRMLEEHRQKKLGVPAAQH